MSDNRAPAGLNRACYCGNDRFGHEAGKPAWCSNRAPAGARDALEAAERNITDLREVLWAVAQYRHHAGNCEVYDTEFCTCGLRNTMDRVRAVYDRTTEEERHA